MNVRFLPSNKMVKVESGTLLTDAAAMAGIVLNMPCGGEGKCGKCTVRIRRSDDDTIAFTEVRACQVEVNEALTVEVPQEAYLSTWIQTAEHADATLTPNIQAGKHAGEAGLGVAIDIGTTTVAAELLDLETGQTLAVASRLNPQTRFGDDVISRIRHACENETGLSEMHAAVTEAIDQMLGQLHEKTETNGRDVKRIVAAGNTTMQHILSRADVSGLVRIPYAPATFDAAVGDAAEFGLKSGSEARVYVFPVIGGFVGGDTVAGVICRDQLIEHDPGEHGAPEPALLIDIGTNGEMVLFAEGKRWSAATAAGPAFEGARIMQGMRATTGAIERVTYDPANDAIEIETIGGAPPRGICGSGLIDAAAAMLRAGAVSSDGRLLAKEDEEASSLADCVRQRLIAIDGQSAFVLADEKMTGNNRPVVLTQKDIRELQLASGAIRAGAITLLRQAGFEPADLRHLYIAGGFGQYIRRSNAQRIGLLPQGVQAERIRFLGNTSLSGAKLALLSPSISDTLHKVARGIEHVDLGADPQFQWTFAEAMLFPEKD